MRTIDEELSRLQALRHTYGGNADPDTCLLETFSFDVKVSGHVQVTVQATSLQEAEHRARQKVETFCKEVPAWDLRDKALELTLLGQLKH